jgi:16S rRNA G966 N2-methylase RsmD
VDLFAGSGAVAIHVAQRFPIPVLSYDLQTYSAVLTGAVIERERRLGWEALWQRWKRRAVARFQKVKVPPDAQLTQPVVSDCRRWSADQAELVITRAYGGYYFSPRQAVWIDALLDALPERGHARQVGLAAIVQAASRCAAAPGHTAQPFQPTRGAKPFLKDAWDKDFVQCAKHAFSGLAVLFARERGEAKVGDANQQAQQLRQNDIAFIDPPYSGVHYSRFYHVLETIARREAVSVSGEGRYPSPESRPWSRYSVKSEAGAALDDLLQTIASRDARAILTFPVHDCSNGLSGEKVHQIAIKYFKVKPVKVRSTLSTLGGRGKGEKEAGRAARRKTKELMLVLQPK